VAFFRFGAAFFRFVVAFFRFGAAFFLFGAAFLFTVAFLRLVVAFFFVAMSVLPCEFCMQFKYNLSDGKYQLGPTGSRLWVYSVCL